MPGVLIKDLPTHLHHLLKERARAHRRSLSGEVLVILEGALLAQAGPPTLDEIDAMRVRGQRPLSQDLLDEARDTGRP